MAEISLNNGNSYMDASSAMPMIEERHLWEAVVNLMDDETREQVHTELATCSELEFLTRYLELAPCDLVIG